MSEETDATATGAGTGAVAGAAAGTMVFPGIGTAIGAAAGAVIGGASGYISARGAGKRRKAQEEARAKYQRALDQYRATEAAQSRQREGLIQRQGGQANANFATYMGRKPGDQTAALQQSTADQSAALYAAQAPTPALAGPLAGEYQAEMKQRVAAPLNSMALDYSADQQDFAGDQNVRDYQMSESALSRERSIFEQQAHVGTANSNSALNKAQAEYGLGREQANSAGNEQMMYGALLNSGMQMGNQYASAKRQSALRNDGYNQQSANPALMSNNQDSWNSRVPQRRNNYDGMQA